MYETIKLIHVASAAISIAGFLLRGLWMLSDSALLHARPTRVLPHVVDTILLASAIFLAVTIPAYPGFGQWLTAKVLALGVYIVLGTIALKRGKTKTVRVAAWLGALLTFAYIVAVALTRSATLNWF